MRLASVVSSPERHQPRAVPRLSLVTFPLVTFSLLSGAFWRETMKGFRPFHLLIAAVLLVSPAFAHHLAVVVDKDNNTGSVSSANLSRIFKSEMKKWPDGKTVV